jgi:hypothetical protein
LAPVASFAARRNSPSTERHADEQLARDDREAFQQLRAPLDERGGGRGPGERHADEHPRRQRPLELVAMVHEDHGQPDPRAPPEGCDSPQHAAPRRAALRRIGPRGPDARKLAAGPEAGRARVPCP